MEKLSTRKTKILDILDEQIADLEEKLKKAQPLIDELNQLKRTRATLLSERSVTGSVSASTKLTMEQVIQAFREQDNEAMTAKEMANYLGVSEQAVRSHFNRNTDTRYRKNGDGKWSLIGEGDDDEEE